MYQWNASDYEKNSSGRERAAEAIIPMLELEGHEHILDIGCGDGKVTQRWLLVSLMTRKVVY